MKELWQAAYEGCIERIMNESNLSYEGAQAKLDEIIQNGGKIVEAYVQDYLINCYEH